MRSAPKGGPKYGGIMPTLAVPIAPDEGVDEAALRRLVQRVKPTADAIVVLGSSGQGPVLPEKSRWQAVEIVLDEAKADLPVIIGSGELNLSNAIRVHQKAKDMGVGAALALCPFYFPLGPEELVSFYTRLAAEGGLDVIIYHYPQYSKANIPAPVLERLSKVPGVVGIKDSGGDFVQFQAYLTVTQGSPFAVIQGRAPLEAVSLFAGAAGCITPVANVDPGTEVKLLAAARAGRAEEAMSLQRRVSKIAALINHKGLPLPVGLNAVLSLMGLCRPDTVAPLPSLAPSDLEYLRVQLAELGLLAK